MRKLLGMDNENELHPIYTDPIYAGLSALSKYLEEHVDHESFGESLRRIDQLQDLYREKCDEHDRELNRRLNAATAGGTARSLPGKAKSRF